MSIVPIRRALISVSDKTGLTELAQGLAAAGVEIYSTGGTFRHLEQAGVRVRDVAGYTGFPEIMDGRVKTLHPKIFAGLLCRHDRADDRQSLAEQQGAPFELAVVNLYPFAQTIARPGVSTEEAIEQIDIGGPSLVRAAAKNHAFAAIATSPQQYPLLLEELQSQGGTTLATRRRLAAAAFAHTAAYDQEIAAWFERTGFDRSQESAEAGAAETSETGPATCPPTINLRLRRLSTLRYGENPHQPAGLYATVTGGSGDGGESGEAGGLARAEQRWGKELSYNNLLDLDSALNMVRDLAAPAVAVIKHNNPCGAAEHEDLATAVRRALDGDPVSAFGSVLGFNRPLTAAAAAVLAEPGRFVEAILAPGFDDEAFQILTTRPSWKANVRLLSAPVGRGARASWELRPIDGGFLAQAPDAGVDDDAGWRVVTERRPDAALLPELRFAWHMVRHVKSNAIVAVRERALIGVGAGQMSRVDSVRIALEKAGERGRGAVLASDAFFPFADSIDLAVAAGIVAIVQPGGSKRDGEVVEACNRHGIAMLFTGRRHFRH